MLSLYTQKSDYCKYITTEGKEKKQKMSGYKKKWKLPHFSFITEERAFYAMNI